MTAPQRSRILPKTLATPVQVRSLRAGLGSVDGVPGLEPGLAQPPAVLPVPCVHGRGSRYTTPQGAEGSGLRTEQDFLAAIAAAPDQASAEVLRGHLVTLRQQKRGRQVLARDGYDASAAVSS